MSAVWEFDMYLEKSRLWSRAYKAYFMFNSSEYEMVSANKYENGNNSLHFHIYLERKVANNRQLFSSCLLDNQNGGLCE